MPRTKIKKRIIPKSKIEPAKKELITIILLCDLPGYRMKSYGPVSLINIKKKFLIDIQIEAIKKAFDNFEIIICCGFDGEKICKHVRSKYEDFNIRIVENQFFNSSNSCEGVRLSINNTLNNKILICDGGLLINKKILSLFDKNKNCTIIQNDQSDNFEIGVNIDSKCKAQHFSFGAYKTWAEMIYLNGKEIIEDLRKFLNHEDSKKKFIFEAMNDLIKDKYEISCIENKFPLYKINNIKTYHEIRENHEIFNI